MLAIHMPSKTPCFGTLVIMSSQEEPDQKNSSNALLPTADDKTSTKASWFDPSHNAMAPSLSCWTSLWWLAWSQEKMVFAWLHFLVKNLLLPRCPNVLLKKSSTAEHTGRDKGMKRPATAAALRSKRPAPALQEPAPDHAAAATHELQAEEELPVSCLKYFFLISIAIQPASDFWAQTLPSFHPSLFCPFLPSSFLLS